MIQKIKELLECFSSDDIHLIQCEHKWCDAYGYEKSQMKKDLLDYITNLQQENEDFKTIIKQYVDIVLHDRKEIDRLQQENEFLKLNNPEMNIEHFRIVKENKRKIDNLRKENEDFKTIIKQYVDIVLHDRKEIDRLQQEINKLTAESTEWESKFYDLQEKYNDLLEVHKIENNDIQELQERVEKTIEYINENLTLVSILDGKKFYGLNDYKFSYLDLLNILQGSDEK